MGNKLANPEYRVDVLHYLSIAFCDLLVNLMPKIRMCLLLRLNQMLYYGSVSVISLQHRKLFYLHVFVMLGPKVGTSIKCLSQGHSEALPHWESNQDFATFLLLARRLYQLWLLIDAWLNHLGSAIHV